jgi:multisubunit Na+/H+ antiporter MnhC subunit
MEEQTKVEGKMKEGTTIAAIILTAFIVGIASITVMLFSGCVLNNENIIQYGSDDSTRQEQEAQGSLEAAIETPLQKL